MVTFLPKPAFQRSKQGGHSTLKGDEKSKKKKQKYNSIVECRRAEPKQKMVGNIYPLCRHHANGYLEQIKRYNGSQ